MTETPTDAAPPVFLRTAEVAELCGVDTTTVRRWADAGKLTAVRIAGGPRRYREADVRALIAASEA